MLQLLLQVASAAESIEEPTHIGLLITIAATAAGLGKMWLKFKKDEQQARKVEKKLEQSWADSWGEDSLSGIAKPNPGRTLPQLIEFLHADFQEHKREAARRFDQIHSDIGKIKGKLDLN